MDPIWLCVTTLLLHVLINRLLGRLHGYFRLLQWPVMQLAAMAAHALFASGPVFWLLQWSSHLTGVTGSAGDVLACLLAAGAAGLAVRRRARAGNRLPA